MKSQNLCFFIIFLLHFISCNENKLENPDISNHEKEYISIHGELSEEQIKKYYPNILDTIKDIRIVGSEKLDLNLKNNDIMVSLLHNTGTFDQMILCTHNKNHNLIDNYYIGKETMFDNEGSHTIDYQIIDKNLIKFNHVNWGYINQEDIDTLNHYNYIIFIDNQGKIIKK